MQIFLTKKRIFVIIGIGAIILASTIIGFSSLANLPGEKPEMSINKNIIFVSAKEHRQEQIKQAKIENPHVKEIISSCGVDEHCTVDSFQKLSKTEDEKIILSAIDDYLSVFQGSEYDCHHMAHHIGEFLLAYSNGNLSKALLTGSQKCGGALYHGIVENYLVSGTLLKKVKLDELKISNLCDSVNANPESQIRLECSHGFGHGFFKVYNFDIQKSVNKCDDFITNLERTACYNGIFMENQIQYYQYGEGVFDSEDILFPCNELDEQKSPSCYSYQAFHILSQSKFSIKQALSECDKIPQMESIKACYSGVGIQGMAMKKNVNDFVSLCQTGKPEFQEFCIVGGTNYLVDQIGTSKAITLCESVPEVFVPSCYNSVIVYINRLYDSSTDLEQQCAKINHQEYYVKCINY